MADDMIKKHREFLKDTLRLQINFHLTDQNQGVSVLINAEIAEKGRFRMKTRQRH